MDPFSATILGVPAATGLYGVRCAFNSKLSPINRVVGGLSGLFGCAVALGVAAALMATGIDKTGAGYFLAFAAPMLTAISAVGGTYCLGASVQEGYTRRKFENAEPVVNTPS